VETPQHLPSIDLLGHPGHVPGQDQFSERIATAAAAGMASLCPRGHSHARYDVYTVTNILTDLI